MSRILLNCHPELEFTFGLPLTAMEKYAASEIIFAENVIALWTNFVKTGYDFTTIFTKGVKLLMMSKVLRAFF